MSSFRKRQVQKPILGTLTSPQTGQIITSSGNPSLDALFGGGLPIGSICLIEEDKYVTYSRVLAKYFLAEGILSGHTCFIGSLDDDPNDILKKLPKPLSEQEAEEEKNNESSSGDEEANGLRIAWRYQGLPIVNSEHKNLKIGHHFNLMDHMSPLTLDFSDYIVWSDDDPYLLADTTNFQDEDEDEIKDHFDNSNDCSDANVGDKTEGDPENASGDQINITKVVKMEKKSPEDVEGRKIFYNPKYLRLLHKLQSILSSNKFKEGERGQKFLCRVCITSLGSPMWYDDCFAKDILKFFTILRSMIRNTVSVCFITMPLNLVSKIDPTLVQKIRNLVDYAIELESFAGSDKEANHAYKEYNGFFQLRKVTALNTLSVYLPETTDLAFKLRRKKFVIEKLHLPPELQENNEAAKKSADILPSSNCSFTPLATPKVDLDF